MAIPRSKEQFVAYAKGTWPFNQTFIGNITPIAQEHEGMSVLVGDSRRQVLVDGDKDIEVVQE